ncbi:hypothetical protein [Salipaludibacillus sp. CF4.18]|uniref:hypothetical protein n=1 Tax=Salipaludibacillus sp. CF4.18 TaxID=3373081 RepID=UPI003EE5CABC
MNVENKRIRFLAISLISLFAVGLLAYYLLVIQPLNEQISDQEDQLMTEEDILYSLENSQEETVEYEDHQITSLLKRVPVHPWIDHWMIDIERLEIVSDISIEEFVFSKDILLRPSFDNIEEESEEAEERITDQNEPAEELDTDIEDVEDPVVVETDSTQQDINGITASLTGHAETYENIYDYIAEIEKLERFTEVYSLYFQAPSEATLLEDEYELEGEEEVEEEDETIVFNVLVSTYYMEELLPEFGEFERQGPFSTPFNKETPFFQLP